jgi:hypothetical protein
MVNPQHLADRFLLRTPFRQCEAAEMVRCPRRSLHLRQLLQDGVELLYEREVAPAEFVNVAEDPKYSDTLKGLCEKALKYKDEYSRE